MSGNRIAGVALVGVGLLMLLELVGVGFLGWTWSAALLFLGIALLWSFQSRRDDSGKVFTGSLLVLLAVLFLGGKWNWWEMSSAWPFFVLAPGVALLVMSRVDPHRRDASVPGWIAIGVALVLYFFTTGLFTSLLLLVFNVIELLVAVLVPLGLIALGGWMLFGHRRAKTDRSPIPEKVEPSVGVESEAGYDSEPTAADSVPEDESDPEAALGAEAHVPVHDLDEADDIEESAEYEEIPLVEPPVDGVTDADFEEEDDEDDDFSRS